MAGAVVTVGVGSEGVFVRVGATGKDGVGGKVVFVGVGIMEMVGVGEMDWILQATTASGRTTRNGISLRFKAFSFFIYGTIRVQWKPSAVR